jgi:hypothetical protein
MSIMTSGYTTKIVEFSVTATDYLEDGNELYSLFNRNVFVESVSAHSKWNTTNGSNHIPAPTITIGYYEITAKGNKSSVYKQKANVESYTSIPSDVFEALKNAYYVEAQKQVQNAFVGA